MHEMCRIIGVPANSGWTRRLQDVQRWFSAFSDSQGDTSRRGICHQSRRLAARAQRCDWQTVADILVVWFGWYARRRNADLRCHWVYAGNSRPVIFLAFLTLEKRPLCLLIRQHWLKSWGSTSHLIQKWAISEMLYQLVQSLGMCWENKTQKDIQKIYIQ